MHIIIFKFYLEDTLQYLDYQKMNNSKHSRPSIIGVTWLITLVGQSQQWVLTTHVKNSSQKELEKWFESVLIIHTPLSPFFLIALIQLSSQKAILRWKKY